MSVTDIEHRLLEHLQGRTAIPDGMFNDYISYLDGQVQRSREAREHWTALRGKKETRKKKKKTPAGGGGYADPRTEGYFRRISRFYEKHDPKMVAGVDVLLETYCGREEAFLAKLVERYGPEPEDAEEAGGLALSLTVGKSAGDLAPKSPRYELNRTVSEFAETKRDRFGFEVEDEPLFAQLEARRTSSPVAAAHEAVREFLRARFDTANLVEDMSEKLDDAGDDAEDLRQRLTEAITAAGVPEEERPSVWFAVTGAFRAREAAEQPSFADAGTRTAPAESLATIKKDMGRTFPMCDAFDEGRPARKELHGVLSAFAATDPGGYCQGLNFIAGLLLLYVSADQAYHILHRIASHERYNRGYYGLAMEMCHRDLAVLHTLVQAHHGAVLEKFEADHLSLTDLFIRWYLTLFIDCFPLQTVLQLWDVYFAAGIPFIFSLILAFIDTHRDLIMAADGLGPTLLAVKNEALRTVDPSALISLALEKYPLSLSELLSMRTEAEATLAEQQREQQEKRDAFNKKRAEKDRQTGEEDASPRARIKGMLSFSRKKK